MADGAAIHPEHRHQSFRRGEVGDADVVADRDHLDRGILQLPGGRLVAILVRRQEPQIKRRRVIVSAADRPAGTRFPAFEQEFAEFFGAKYAVMVNSGSSANLVAIAAAVFARSGW